MRTPQTPSRINEMDAMRSVLMLLGVFLHAALPYCVGAHWLVNDDHESAFFNAMVSTIHVARMPAFFVVAGYFAMLILRSRSTSLFVADRLRRTMVPFLAVLLTFNLVQMWMLADPAPSGVLDFLLHTAIPKVWTGNAVGHLWFLLDLAMYVLVVAVLALPIRALADSHWPQRLATPWLVRGIILAACMAPLAVAVADHVSHGALGHVFAGVIDSIELFDYAPFFAIGMLLQWHTDLLRLFSRPGWLDAVLGVIAAVITIYIPADAPDAAHAVDLITYAAVAWVATRIIFWGFRRWASKPSATYRYLSAASYSVYLFHHIMVIAMALLLLPLAWPAWIKYLIVLSTAAAWALAIHHFIVRPYAVPGFLFNGRRQRKQIAPGVIRTGAPV